jgi:hypothetical protein
MSKAAKIIEETPLEQYPLASLYTWSRLETLHPKPLAPIDRKKPSLLKHRHVVTRARTSDKPAPLIIHWPKGA